MKDNKELSKKKYIYRIYSSEDKVVHCERLPIIYSNKTFTYCKVNGNYDLERFCTKDIKEGFYSVLDLRVSYYNMVSQCFYNVENFDREEIEQYLFKKRANDDIEYVKKEVERAKKLYEKSIERLNRLKEINNIS